MNELTRTAVEAQRGDRRALALLVEKTQADIWRYCAYLNGAAEADDLTQDTFGRAIAALPRFRADCDVRSWLLTIARRVCADQVRSQIRRRKLLGRLRPFTIVETPNGAGSVELGTLIDALDRERREAFVLTQYLGLSYHETAEVCHCPVGTIRSRVARARTALIEGLQDDQPRRSERG